MHAQPAATPGPGCNLQNMPDGRVDCHLFCEVVHVPKALRQIHFDNYHQVLSGSLPASRWTCSGAVVRNTIRTLREKHGCHLLHPPSLVTLTSQASIECGHTEQTARLD